MGKVNYDEIQVGDLVVYYSDYFNTNRIGYVTNIIGINVWAYWSNSDEVSHGKMPLDRITGHWKVINFEEETKVEDYIDKELDELKVYTGKEAIEALLEGKTLERGTSTQYRLGDEGLIADYKDGKGWVESLLLINNLLKLKLHEVATPQVGDWVKVTLSDSTIVGCLTNVNDFYMYAKWSHLPNSNTTVRLDSNWEILTPELIAEYKREQVFAKVGRKLNEFREGDIVFVGFHIGKTAIVTSKKNKDKVWLHSINEQGKGYTAKPHQLTPIAFAENQVDLS
ncbi:hypothetical protein [Bacillus mycoides]|uniref:hypothetical protein n=1 Tax=Bacillus mycoides TaxID=1405 RepID=UPI00027C1796|nr:hypothetical protein [Bacillus mycoides]EJV59335.1 hypothetical protein IEU_05600 [Bacillus mycoides]